MISVSIVCFNEAKRLVNCLSSAADFADEIVVLDLGSSDQTKKVCKEFKTRLFFHKKEPYVELLRNYSISKAKGEWVLILDPDEALSKNLADRLKEVVKDKHYVAVNISRKNIFFGKWIKHTNWWPDRHIRFFKRGKVTWNEKIHSYPKVDGKVLSLPADENLAIKHFGYDSIGQFIDRQNRYSEVEAQNLFKMGERFSWVNFFWRPSREFLVRYIRHGGFLDGFYGFALTFLMMIYQLQVMIKLWELEKQKV